MTVTDLAAERADRLETKVDLLTEQLAVLTEEAERQRRRRVDFEEFRTDLTRISEGALAVAGRELESLGDTADLADTARLVRRFVEVAPTLERTLDALDQIVALVDDLAPLGSDMTQVVIERLAEADRRGYFRIARAGADMADRIVTGFDEEDVTQLGDNIVAILETVKEITQPEMLALLGHMVDAVQSQRRRIELEPEAAPSLWALARQVRDPDVRRGMSRALATLRAVSVETGPEPSTPEQNTPSPGGI